ncbi:recombinase A [Acinetobacter baumannii]|nr:recombinase A [Acinetobacter baumannii]
MDENKSKALQAALSQIEKQFGKNTVMRLGDNTVQAVEAVSTGSLTLDIALGLVVYQKAVLSKFMVLNLLVKPQ